VSGIASSGRPDIAQGVNTTLKAPSSFFWNISYAAGASVSGVYGGEVDPLPMMEMFDRGISMRMGQCHVKRWIPDLLPLVLDDADPLGTLDLTTHHLPLAQAPHGYDIFQQKQDDCIKVVLHP
jgi:threonine dehydrogenase-like Zn-dependent dehydrogenase